MRDAETYASVRFPVVIFSHGKGGLRQQSTFYTAVLASHGYVVVSPDHEGDTIVELLRKDGVDIARRTVAKYREAMRIPSSVQRRREKAGQHRLGAKAPDEDGRRGGSMIVFRPKAQAFDHTG